MARVSVKINLRGINKLMTSAGVQADIDARGERIAEKAGEGFEYVRGARAHRWVARGYVQVASREAAIRQAEESVLEHAIDAAR